LKRRIFIAAPFVLIDTCNTKYVNTALTKNKSN
jgi:hypothetical protein